MSEVSIFEQASRAGLQFSHKGTIGVDDLWDLSLEDLDSIHRNLTTSLKQTEGGLLTKRTSANKELDLKIAVVTHVFGVKQEEINEKKLAVANRQKKEKLKEILERKQNGELENKTPEELQKMIDELS